MLVQRGTMEIPLIDRDLRRDGNPIFPILYRQQILVSCRLAMPRVDCFELVSYTEREIQELHTNEAESYFFLIGFLSTDVTN